MSDNHKTIHEFDLNMICDFFSNFKRQGPGSPEATLKALSFIDNLTDKSLIADIGCGTGGQTMILADAAKGNITGIDLFPKFIEIFNHNAAELNLQKRVKGVVGSMDALPFEENSLDLIWSEGSIYNIGFERGINEWRKFIKLGGYAAISESAWFTETRPAEIHDFWMSSYAEIDTIHNQVTTIQKSGYLPVASFILNEDCWLKYYYGQASVNQAKFLQKYPNNKAADDLVASQRHEEQLYRKYKEFYGYVFYIIKKV